VRFRRRDVEAKLERRGFGWLIFSTSIVRSEALGLRILSALSLHKRWIEVSLHAISTAAATAGHHSHTYNEYIPEDCRKKNSARAKRDC
jgi:hypothetical protein